jgi:hypothetical protein
MRVLLIILLSALGVCAQPVVRTFSTTNYWGFSPSQFRTNGQTVVLTNFDGAMSATGAVRFTNWTTIGLIVTNAADGTDNTNGVVQFTNSFANTYGFWISACPQLSDGSLFLILDNDSLQGGVGPNLLKKMNVTDCFAVGSLPGLSAIKSGRTVYMLDSNVQGTGAAQQCTNFNFATVIGGSLTLSVATNVAFSVVIGTGSGAAQESIDDTIIGSTAQPYCPGNSGQNTIIGSQALTLSTAGNSNIIIGAYADLPNDGVDAQLNIGNLIWGTGLRIESGANLPANGTVTVNGRITANTGVSSKSRNTLAPVAITVGASPFTFKNDGTAGNAGGTNNVEVYVDAGTVSSITVNGGAIFTSTGKTYTLQPGESSVVTYTVVPTMKYKPF